MAILLVGLRPSSYCLFEINEYWWDKCLMESHFFLVYWIWLVVFRLLIYKTKTRSRELLVFVLWRYFFADCPWSFLYIRPGLIHFSFYSYIIVILNFHKTCIWQYNFLCLSYPSLTLNFLGRGSLNMTNYVIIIKGEN